MPFRWFVIVVVALSLYSGLSCMAAEPERVVFPSADGKTDLVGYLFKGINGASRSPAVVMMHGRAGAYSSAAKGVYDSSTLSRRHRAWGEIWASRGYVALLVDAFGSARLPAGISALQL